MTGTIEHDTSSEGVSIPVDHAFVCDACGHRWYYTRNRCPNCGTSERSTYELTDGDLVAWTEIAVTPSDVRSPNRIGFARFGDVHVIAQVDADAVSVGDPVAFAGSHRLREGVDDEHPRLTPIESA